MEDIINQIRKELKKKAKPLSKKDLEWARKIVGKDFIPLGVKTADVWKISRDVYKKNAGSLDFNQGLKISEKLFQSKYQEEKFAGFGFISHFSNKFNEQTLEIFKSWIEKYCHNWAVCDSFCLKVIAPFLAKNLALVTKIEPWSKSKNLWVKRASLVIVLKLSRYLKPDYLLRRAEPFMKAENPLLQKAVGWLLKESSKHHQKEIVDFLLRWKKRTPRLILRYATEKVDKATRNRVLEN